MRLLLDNDVPVSLARLLNEASHDAVTARGLSISHYHDHEHLLIAHRTNRILVTHNARDFIMLEAAWRDWSRSWGNPENHPGIILLPQGRELRAYAQDIEALPASGISLDGSIVRHHAEHGWIPCPLIAHMS